MDMREFYMNMSGKKASDLYKCVERELGARSDYEYLVNGGTLDIRARNERARQLMHSLSLVRNSLSSEEEDYTVAEHLERDPRHGAIALYAVYSADKEFGVNC